MKLVLALLVAATLLGRDGLAAGATVTLVVHVPADTPADASVYIAGNHPSLGLWAPGKQSLTRRLDGAWEATLELPTGFELEYKITLGAWESVERGPLGQDIPNRRATIDDGLNLEINVATWASGERTPLTPSLTGNVKLIENFESKVLGNWRNLVVYLPPGYDDEPTRRYPVLYMHDGQNLFDRATSAFGVEWGADEAAEELIRAGKIEPLIIVGIYTDADRINELSDTRSERFGAGGKAALYGRFLVDELKPFVDGTYRTNPDRANTAVGGSSLGGLVSLYLIEQCPEVFSRCAAVSPALSWNDEALTGRWEETHPRLPLDRTRFWIDVGTKETVIGLPVDAYLNAVRRLVGVLNEGGLEDGVAYRFVVDVGAEHNEAAWQKRFPQILEFLFPAESPAASQH